MNSIELKKNEDIIDFVAENSEIVKGNLIVMMKKC